VPKLRRWDSFSSRVCSAEWFEEDSDTESDSESDSEESREIGVPLSSEGRSFKEVIVFGCEVDRAGALELLLLSSEDDEDEEEEAGEWFAISDVTTLGWRFDESGALLLSSSEDDEEEEEEDDDAEE